MDVLRRKYAFLFKYKVFFPNHFFSELMQITCFNITYSVTLDNVNILKFHTQFSRFSYSWLGSWDSSWILLYCSTTRIWVTIANTDFLWILHQVDYVIKQILFVRHVHHSLRWRNCKLCRSTGSSRAKLRSMSGSRSEEHPKRQAPAHTCVPGSHSRHEASAVSRVCFVSMCFSYASP